MSILTINNMALQLVANDFSNGHNPTNGGPTKTSRALAIIHLAAHDAYAEVDKANNGGVSKLKTQLPTITKPQAGLDPNHALLGAGFRAAELLYPDDKKFINTIRSMIPNNSSVKYGRQVGDQWIKFRSNDKSTLPQLDTNYSMEPGRHRPDPLNPDQQALGRNWPMVTPFILKNVTTDAFLEKPPALNSEEYAKAFNQVKKDGKNDVISQDPEKAIIGIFWGYDGANQLGTPPRLYNQVVRKTEIDGVKFDDLDEIKKIQVLTAINVAMADAGIAAWHWKYEYDVWRPVLGVRESDVGSGPTGKGDGNISLKGDPFWLPLGAPRSNPFPSPTFGAKGENFTPNFPAYPSGHATFGAACFETVAGLFSKTTEEIMVVDFVSDEFDGKTTDNQGVTRTKLTTSFSLKKAIQDNNISRIYLGVHWIFDATGGEKVGRDVATKVIAAF